MTASNTWFPVEPREVAKPRSKEQPAFCVDCGSKLRYARGLGGYYPDTLICVSSSMHALWFTSDNGRTWEMNE